MEDPGFRGYVASIVAFSGAALMAL